jgi:hypothetical protein
MPALIVLPSEVVNAFSTWVDTMAAQFADASHERRQVALSDARVRLQLQLSALGTVSTAISGAIVSAIAEKTSVR